MESSTISALVLCVEQESLRALEQAFSQFRVEPQVCVTGRAVQEALLEKDHDLLVVDLDVPDAGQALEAWSSRGPNSSKAVTAFARSFQAMTPEHRKCVQFYLQKPLTPALLIKTLRVARSSVLKKRRSVYRCMLNIKAEAGLSSSGTTNAEKLHPVTMLDISKAGACLETARDLRRGSIVQIVFRLPDTQDLTQATGIVVWTENNGLAGVQFTFIPPQQKLKMEAWLNERGPSVTQVTVVDNPNEIRERTPRTLLRH